MKEEASEQSVQSNVSAILDSDNPIPFKFIKWEIFTSLAKKLDPHKVVNGNDWRGLADKLGYTSEDIIDFESKQSLDGSNTIKVLKNYCHEQGATVNNLYTALEKIDRKDALEELRKGLPEIQRLYRESLRKKHVHQELMTENDCGCSGCDATNMAWSSEQYNSYCFEQKKFMNSVNSYSMCMNSRQHVPMAHGNKQYQRHKSVDMMDGMMRGYDRPSPEMKRLRSLPCADSMMVRGHDSQSQYFRDMEPMDHAMTIRDDPVSAARVMMRDIQRCTHSGVMPVSMSGMYHSTESSYHQPFVQRSGLKLQIPVPNSLNSYKNQIQDDFCSPSPTTPSTPLVQLTKLANEKKFQPDEAYNNLIRHKQEEEMLMNKVGHQQVHLNDMDKLGTSSAHHHVHGNNHAKDLPIKMEDSNGRSKTSEPPNTFPLRLKSSSCSPNSSQLMKSASLPDNMKLSEFKKGFRHIKVFVTYAADDKKHTQRVINLCKNLVKNGFTCCVDISSKSLQEEDPDKWCNDRFDEADFILAVISQKFRMEADSCEMDNDADDSDSMDEDDRRQELKLQRLHTKQIYRLMYREYLQNNNRTGRIVPLLFQGMVIDLIPEWMRFAYSKLIYIWPDQYKDLYWMLTKPENLVPEHIAPVINRSLQHNSEEKENGEALEINHDSE